MVVFPWVSAIVVSPTPAWFMPGPSNVMQVGSLRRFKLLAGLCLVVGALMVAATNPDLTPEPAQAVMPEPLRELSVSREVTAGAPEASQPRVD